MEPTHKVSFYYFTDCRTNADVCAQNDLAALALALESIREEKWVINPGFWVKIERIGGR